jgi:hypothetical protein
MIVFDLFFVVDTNGFSVFKFAVQQNLNFFFGKANYFVFFN